MKNIKYILSVLLMVIGVSGCIDRDILDAKEGVKLPPVTHLKSSIENKKDITLQWTIPDNIPEQMKRPLSVYIQVYKESTLEYQISLENEPATWKYTLPEPDAKYRVVVKMQGSLKEQLYGESNEIYSLGQTVDVN